MKHKIHKNRDRRPRRHTEALFEYAGMPPGFDLGKGCKGQQESLSHAEHQQTEDEGKYEPSAEWNW